MLGGIANAVMQVMEFLKTLKLQDVAYSVGLA
jgi:hypothetical protein